MSNTAETTIHEVVIHKDRCVGCGLCVSDCVGSVLGIEDGKAIMKGAGCILCGHCEAICPQNAVELTGFSDVPEEFEEEVRLDPETLLKAIKTRRSIRNFLDREVPDDVVNMILEAGRLAPTAANGQKTGFVVLRDRRKECEACGVSTARKLLNVGKKLVPALKNMNLDDDFFFKKAPLVIVIFGKDKVSASLAAQNMAFMAEANGLGVLFSGFFTVCVNSLSKIRKIMGIKKVPKAVTTLVIGYPGVHYKRTARRKELQVKKV